MESDSTYIYSGSEYRENSDYEYSGFGIRITMIEWDVFASYGLQFNFPSIHYLLDTDVCSHSTIPQLWIWLRLPLFNKLALFHVQKFLGVIHLSQTDFRSIPILLLSSSSSCANNPINPHRRGNMISAPIATILRQILDTLWRYCFC
jgi:hypothetical protein